MTSRTLRAALPALLMASFAACAPTTDPADQLRAYVAQSPDQLIGGDVAMARVGDFILENDQIRIGILGFEASPGPGVFGGTVVDADLQRQDARFRGGNGVDQLAEMFAFANLVVPRPEKTQVTIKEDGSGGERAVVNVTGEGAFFLEALSLLQDKTIQTFIAQNAKMYLTISTDYILEPGKRYMKMVSTLQRSDPVEASPSYCDPWSCDLECPAYYAFGDDGCPVCECASEDVVELDNYQETTAIFDTLLGDPGVRAPGVVGGDFVFFGAQNDIFAPGIGYDEDKAVFDALFQGSDTFTSPLTFDFVAASGGAVSYGFFTANAPGEPDPKVLVPIITSSSTAFVTAGTGCDAGDEACRKINRWTFERYFVVGKGDIASIADVVFEVRGTPVGTLKGVVMDHHRQPAANAHVFLFRDPDATRSWTSVHEIADANFRDIGGAGVLNVIDADVGLDPKEDGDFRATMPEGTYLMVATDEDLIVTSAVQRIVVKAGETQTLAPVLPAPARVKVRVTDGHGQLVPAKLTFVTLDADGQRMDRDGLRRVYMGEGRLGNGIRHLALTKTGETEVEVEPGNTYELIVSRGPEYGVSTHRFTAESGRVVNIAASVVREVDTSGWIAGDFHLHAEPSFDSGMKLARRVISAAAEGLELVVSTDHDVVTDYGPTIRTQGLLDQLQWAIGVEMSTLELGHFIAFPLRYDDLKIPDHDAPDWTCRDGPLLVDELADHIDSVEGVKIMAHPRDGFIGYIDQIGVHPFDMTREPDFLEENNVLLSRSTCEWDAMEVFNSKRFDLIRQPTNREVILYNRCYDRLDAATTMAELDAACPELSPDGPLASCAADARFFECKQRYRRRLAYLVSRDILIRTPEEQDANWDIAIDDSAAEDNCAPGKHTGDIDAGIADQPCIDHPGTYDDWMRWLDKGLAITITAASDSHGLAREPGTPRTYVRSEADVPRQIDPAAAATSMRVGKALPTFGPFVELSVAGREPGDIVTVAAGQPFEAKLRVQTASWFGVDRIEVYVSGRLQKVIEVDHGPEPVIDFDGAITLTAPDRDGFVSVIAMGTEERNLVGPVYLDVAFGELQLPRVASLAFGSIPGLSSFITASPLVPDFFPVFPLAATNAVFLDTDGDGAWTPSTDLPAFCPKDCDPSLDDDTQCPPKQSCLDSGVCGVPINAECRTGPPGAETILQSLIPDGG